MLAYDLGQLRVRTLKNAEERKPNCQRFGNKDKKYRPYAGIWMERAEIILYDWFEDDSISNEKCLL